LILGAAGAGGVSDSGRTVSADFEGVGDGFLDSAYSGNASSNAGIRMGSFMSCVFIAL
jgi:hypothetical protein